MPDIIDVSSSCGDNASALAAAGVQTIIRYYSRDTIRPSKRLNSGEAQQLTQAGLRIGVVHEGRFGDQVSNFEHASGVADGHYARTYATDVIQQPAGSTIYFAVDCDVSSPDIRGRIIPYFQGIIDAFNVNGTQVYDIGVYGSGTVCEALLDGQLSQRAWLAQSRGWSGYSAFDNSGRWALKQQMPSTVAGIPCDPNIRSPSGSIGDFSLGPSFAFEASFPRPMVVNSRAGLHLRTGPGVEFDWVRTLRFGQRLFPITSVGHWTLVDLTGDGAADGFVCGPFLREPSEAASFSNLMTLSKATHRKSNKPVSSTRTKSRP